MEITTEITSEMTAEIPKEMPTEIPAKKSLQNLLQKITAEIPTEITAKKPTEFPTEIPDNCAFVIRRINRAHSGLAVFFAAVDTHRENFFNTHKYFLNQTKIRLYLPFSN